MLESRAENYNRLAQHVFELYDEGKIELERRYQDTLFIKICEDEEITDFVDRERMYQIKDNIYEFEVWIR